MVSKSPRLFLEQSGLLPYRRNQTRLDLKANSINQIKLSTPLPQNIVSQRKEENSNSGTVVDPNKLL